MVSVLLLFATLPECRQNQIAIYLSNPVIIDNRRQTWWRAGRAWLHHATRDRSARPPPRAASRPVSVATPVSESVWPRQSAIQCGHASQPFSQSASQCGHDRHPRCNHVSFFFVLILTTENSVARAAGRARQHARGCTWCPCVQSLCYMGMV